MATVGDQARGIVGQIGGINQTSFLFGAVMFGYLFFITVRGDLPAWLGLLGLAGTTSSTGSTATGASTPATSAVPPAPGAIGGDNALGLLPGLPSIPSISSGAGP